MGKLLSAAAAIAAALFWAACAVWAPPGWADGPQADPPAEQGDEEEKPPLAEDPFPSTIAKLAFRKKLTPGEEKQIAAHVEKWLDRNVLAPSVEALDEAPRQALEKWLSGKVAKGDKRTRRQILLWAIRCQDDVPHAMRILARIASDFPKESGEYWRLALAIALVWDTPYSFRGTGGGGSPPPWKDEEAVDFAQALFRRHVEHEKSAPDAFKGRSLKELPWYAALYLVNVSPKLSQEEIDWAWDRFKSSKETDAVKIYKSLTYDTAYAREGTAKKVSGQEFTLMNLAKVGGVCVEQTYFAFNVGQVVGIPVSSFSTHFHAWIGSLYRTGKRLSDGTPTLTWEMEETSKALGHRGGFPGFSPHSKVYSPHPQTLHTLVQDELAMELDFFQSERDLAPSLACLALAGLTPTGDEVMRRGWLVRSIEAHPLNPYAWKALFRDRVQAPAEPSEYRAPREGTLPFVSFDPDKTWETNGSSATYGSLDGRPGGKAVPPPYGMERLGPLLARDPVSEAEKAAKREKEEPAQTWGALALLLAEGKPYYAVVYNHFLQCRDLLFDPKIDPKAFKDGRQVYKEYMAYLNLFPEYRILWVVSAAKFFQDRGDLPGEERLYDEFLEDAKKFPKLYQTREATLLLYEWVQIRTLLGKLLDPLIKPLEAVYAGPRYQVNIKDSTKHEYTVRGPGPKGVSMLYVQHELMIKVYEACGMPKEAERIRKIHEEILNRK